MLSTYLKLILTTLFWGGTFIAGRYLGQNLDPYLSAFFRFFLATTFLFLILPKRKPHFSLSTWLEVFFLGLTGIFLYNIFFFNGLKYIEAGRAALIIGLTPALITIFSYFFFKEKVFLKNILGIVITFIGETLVLSKGEIKDLLYFKIGTGEILILLCVLSWTAYSLIGKNTLKKHEPLILTSYASLIGTILLFPFAWQKQLLQNIKFLTLKQGFSLLYLAVLGTGLGFVWYYQGIKKIGVFRAGIFINLVPVFSLLLAYIFLNETLSSSTYLGAILVITGIFLTNLKR